MPQTDQNQANASTSSIEAFEPDWNGDGLWSLSADGVLVFSSVEDRGRQPSPSLFAETALYVRGCRLSSFPEGVFIYDGGGELHAFALSNETSLSSNSLILRYRTVVDSGKPPVLVSAALLPAKRTHTDDRLVLFCASAPPAQVIFHAEWSTKTVRSPPHRQSVQRSRFAPVIDGFIHPRFQQFWLLCADSSLVVMDESLQLQERYELPSLFRWGRISLDLMSGTGVIASETGTLRCCHQRDDHVNVSDNRQDRMNCRTRLVSWAITPGEIEADGNATPRGEASARSPAALKRKLTSLCAADGIIISAFADGTVELWPEHTELGEGLEGPMRRWRLRYGAMMLLRADSQGRRIWGWSPAAALLFCWDGSLGSMLRSKSNDRQDTDTVIAYNVAENQHQLLHEEATPEGLISVTRITSPNAWDHLNVEDIAHAVYVLPLDARTKQTHRNQISVFDDEEKTNDDAEALRREQVAQSISAIQHISQLDGVLEYHARSMDTELETLERRVPQLAEALAGCMQAPDVAAPLSEQIDTTTTLERFTESPNECSVCTDRSFISWQTMQLLLEDVGLAVRSLRGHHDAQRQASRMSIDALLKTLMLDHHHPDSAAPAVDGPQSSQLDLVTSNMQSVLYELSERDCTLQRERDELFQALLTENQALACRVQDLEQATKSLAASNQTLRNEVASCTQVLEETRAERDRLRLQLRSAVRAARFFTEQGLGSGAVLHSRAPNASVKSEGVTEKETQ